MASFLQNNGDIILDAVLTDYGRRLLAKGDGSFNIAKFAFGDDEIDYSRYDITAPTGEQDLEIMKTPIFEAFTNNAASMKSALLTLGLENILFMPVMKLKTTGDGSTGTFVDATSKEVFNGFVIPVDLSTTNKTSLSSYALTGAASFDYLPGVLNNNNRQIIIDQGLDSSKLSFNQSLKDTSPMLYETEYNIFVDNRFCNVGKNVAGNLTVKSPLSVDDDNIAVYKETEQSLVNNTSYVSKIEPDSLNNDSPIAGPKGSRLQFTLVPNGNLLYSDAMFTKYGKELVLNGVHQDTKVFKTIRTGVRVVGVTTGYSLEIPVMFAKVITT